MKISDLLADQIDGTRDWTLKLIADIEGDEWFYQPAPGLAHALWLCGHLASSQHTLVFDRCLGKPFIDAGFKSHFPIGGPVKSAREHDYPAPAVVLDAMKQIHIRTVDAVRNMSDALLAEPAFGADGKSIHPHYRDKAGVVAHCNRHEAFHAGQIATIRRLLGKPFLR
ncbi:MAG: DinB family protein [Phycisphaerae bacterium]|nr:DinB family protein [Phycisphaerae bacterium]